MKLCRPSVEDGPSFGNSFFCPPFVQLNPLTPDNAEHSSRANTLILLDSQVTLLTVYDMCKAVDRGMTITGVHLLEKHGGKSGSYVAEK